MPLLARAPPPPLRHRVATAAAASRPRSRRPCAARLHRLRLRVRASGSDPPQQQQVNLSVLRFTLGIPGLDESYLPRWIGIGFGALVLLNHLLSPTPTPAQLVGTNHFIPPATNRHGFLGLTCCVKLQRSEALGLCLAAFSATLPYLGRFLEGAGAAERVPLPEGSRQVFAMSDNLSAAQKEEMAWASYILLRNTNTTSVLIAIGNQLCVRGYWDQPEDISKYAMIEWFKSQVQEAGITDLREVLYFPTSSDIRLGKILPPGILSVLAQPVLNNPDPTNGEIKAEGFILLASNANYAYSEKDRVWIRTVANKFQCA
uniref:Protein COFACTOR ASSEMBLY OF COMPLEX C SUBUNIT B CCB2, chloroplastic n=1 Tax=Leersia perrieri TaxID=77586 RepID=A0A0D9XLP6_9ORYZ